MARAPAEILVTEVCCVRRMAVDDASSWKNAVDRSIDHLRPWMPWIRHEPMSLEAREQMLRDWSASWDSATEFHYGIEVDGDIAGSCGLHRRSDADTLEIGYWVSVDHIGRGVGTAAAAALTAAALTVDGIVAVEILHDQANIASGRIPEKLGYQLFATEQREPTAPAETGVMKRWRFTKPVR